MNHELNDNTKAAAHSEEQNNESLFLKVHESDKAPTAIESIAKQLEANEKAIVAQMAKIAEIAAKALMLASCSEPFHGTVIKDLAAQGAAANEPAYVALHKHLS